ncbi:MAG: leucine-rich repeat protein [Opitutaceae bacterium]
MNKHTRLFAILCIHSTLSALTSGDFEYELINSDTEAEITAYNGSEINLTIPDTIDDKPVTSIGEAVFDGSSIENVTLPGTLITIGIDAFYSSALTSIIIPNSVVSIDYSAFESCESLATITLSEGLESIGADCFAETGITELTLPESLISIDSKAFASTALTTISIPANVTYLGPSAFNDCNDLQSIQVAAGNANYASDDGVLLNKSATILHKFPEGKSGSYTTPSTVTAIEDYAFYKTALLTEIILPTGLETIGTNAFNSSGLSSITIPDSVSALEDNTFSACPNLVGIQLPNNLQTIGSRCFSSCSNLADILLPATIVSIGSNAFANCASLTRIDLPDGITVIQGSTFHGCSNLTNIRLPASLITIQDFAFYSCSSLTRITFPAGLTYIGKVAFNAANQLVPIFLGNAPTTSTNIFQNTSISHLYYISSATGFGDRWSGVATVALDPASFGIASPWLLEHGLAYDTDVHQDLNNDGVSLLMAYALNLDPNQNLAAKMPAISLGNGTTSLVYYGNNEGISYEVEASLDLEDWDSLIVNYSDLDGEWMRTASVSSVEYSQLFLRLSVSEE